MIQKRDPFYENILWICIRENFEKAKSALLKENLDFHYRSNEFLRVAVTNEHLELIEFLMCSEELKSKNALSSLNDPKDYSLESCIMSSRLNSLKKLHEIHGAFLPNTHAYTQYCNVMRNNAYFGAEGGIKNKTMDKSIQALLHYLVFEIDIEVTPPLQEIIDKSQLLSMLFLKKSLDKMPQKEDKLRLKI